MTTVMSASGRRYAVTLSTNTDKSTAEFQYGVGMLHKLKAAIAWRAHKAWKSHYTDLGRAALDRYDTRINTAIDALTEHFGVAPVPGREQIEILDALERFEPHSVAELGSGRSTMIFGAYCANQNARLTCREQSSEWGGAVDDVAAEHFGIRPVIITDLETHDTGARYSADLPDDADFVYQDGPFYDGDFDTRFGKGQFTDVRDLIDRGGRPRFIMIEGKMDCVDILLKHPAIQSEYRFTPSFFWAFHRGKMPNLLNYKWHCEFERIL